MKRIFFRNSQNWDRVFAVSLNENESDSSHTELLSRDDEGDLIYEFDNKAYTHLYFENGKGERTSKIYVGGLSIGVDYKTNLALSKNMTYLFNKFSQKSGRVDTYILEDDKNLIHREDKSKKISVFVPSTYDESIPHGILYFFDAQNLFGNAGFYTKCGDPYGSWQLDVVLKEIYHQYGKNIIVVGIDNADKYRDQELFMDPSGFGKLAPLATALPDEDYSKGHLDGLLDFIKDTLHPLIKNEYTVDENDIGIGGSSMGGIASFYCGLREMNLFKYILSYSPAFGLYEISAFENWFAKKDFIADKEIQPKIHIYCGNGDQLETLLLPSSMIMKKILINYGYDKNKVFETYDKEKPHNEESWRLILCDSFTKLFNLQ